MIQVIDLAASGGCHVFEAPDKKNTWLALFPLGGSLFEVSWYDSAEAAAQASSHSLMGQPTGYWRSYPGNWPGCEIPDEAVSDTNALAIESALPADWVGGCLAEGKIYQEPPPRAVTLVWVSFPDSVPEPPTCEPAITEVFGATGDETPFTEIAIHNPACCLVKVNTSAGSFTIKPDEQGFQTHFDCTVLLRSIEVSGNQCNTGHVHTILTKRS